LLSQIFAYTLPLVSRDLFVVYSSVDVAKTRSFLNKQLKKQIQLPEPELSAVSRKKCVQFVSITSH